MDDVNESGDFNLHEAAEEIIESESNEPSPASTEDSAPEGQPVTDPTKTEAEKVLSPEEILKQVAAEKEDPSAHADLLSKINSLGAIHNGMPLKVDSPEQLKELLQKGVDYTVKTMAHADEVKAKTEEFSRMETQLKERDSQLAQNEQKFQEHINDNQIMEALVLEWQQNDPELFQHIMQAFKSKHAEINRQLPQIQKYEARLKQQEDKISAWEASKDTEVKTNIKQGWEKELSEVQTKNAASLGKLGVKADWKKVEDVWKKDVSNTMTVEQALYAVHGMDIAKANESRLKLLETQNKTKSKLLGRTGVTAGQRGGESEIKFETGDYGAFLKEASANL